MYYCYDKVMGHKVTVLLLTLSFLSVIRLHHLVK